MKNKYLIINKKGKEYSPEQYIKLKQCSEDMKILIRREVFGEKWNSKQNSNYINIANRLGFSWEDNSQIGFINYNYKANLIKNIVEEYARKLVKDIGMPIYEVRGSNFFDLKHPVVKSYAQLFGDRLFESNNMVMSYDASYPQFNLASKMNLKKSSFPFAHFSISDCYRYEQSGECMLLYRSRRFFMPDIHPYFKDVKQAWDWYPKFEEKLKESFKIANREYLNIAKVSSIDNWNQYKEGICNLAVKNNKDILVDIRLDNEDRYWIVDIDYGVIDKFEQFREIGCIQIDIGNAKRLGIEYKDNNNVKYPVIIHSAIPGGIERYIYMLIDNYEQYPIEFQPIQLRIIPISNNHIKYANDLVNKYSNIRIDIDDRDEHISKRIKDSHNEGIPNILVVGDKEVKDNKDPDILINLDKSINKNIPFIPISWPIFMSKRIL